MGCVTPPDPDLLARGWERRFIADARMAREAEESYRALGFEVRLEPLRTDDMNDACRGCEALLQQFKVVYTRKASK